MRAWLMCLVLVPWVYDFVLMFLPEHTQQFIHNFPFSMMYPDPASFQSEPAQAPTPENFGSTDNLPPF